MDPDYELFARVVAAGSLSAAARASLTSASTVSKRLARLEARLGIRLIQRTTRRLAMTPAGEQFYSDITAILRAVREAENRISGIIEAPSGILRVSAPTSFGRLHVTPHLHSFLAAHPRVQLELDLSDEYVDLFAGHTDVAIRIVSELPASLEAHRLVSNRRILCASLAYIDRYGSPDTIKSLVGHRLLAATGQLPWRLASGQRRTVVDGRSYVRTNSSEVVRELAITGVGIALRSLWDIAPFLADGTLLRILPEWQGPSHVGVYAVHPKSPTIAPAVTAFIAFLNETFAASHWE
jgi:DNA-binding transcriptional LysR family regulator